MTITEQDLDYPPSTAIADDEIAALSAFAESVRNTQRLLTAAIGSCDGELAPGISYATAVFAGANGDPE